MHCPLFLLTSVLAVSAASPFAVRLNRGISTRSSHAIPVNLGSAEDYTILGETGVSTVPESQVQGNIGVSPIAATGLTGFALTLDSTGVFSTSTQVSGKLYAANYVVPTPTNLISAMSDMKTARTSAAGQIPADFVDFESGILGSSVLVAGIYNFNTAVHIPGSLTLNGAATDVFVFQIAGTLKQASGSEIILTGGLTASTVFFAVADTVAIGTSANFQGVILGAKDVTFQTASSITGRVYAQSVVTLQQTIVTMSA